MMSTGNRIVWLDIAKGITILLMVIGHTSIPQIVSDWIWAFHMPLFFFASGVCTKFEKDSLGTFIKKKFIGIGRPFLIYSTIVVLISKISQLNQIFSFKEGWGGYALWFVPVLFVALILAKVYFLFSKKVYRYTYMALLLSVSCILSYSKISLPWNMAVAPYAAVLLLMAYITREKILQCVWLKWWVMFVSLLVVIFVSHHWRLDMCYNSILPIIPITVGAIAGSLLVMGLSVCIERYGGRLANVLQGIGEETFIVVAFSQIIIMVLNRYTPMNAALKYVLLVVILLIIKYLKDWVVCAYRKKAEDKV